jgi:D-glycero-alpha-D-manno-heptose-7-phosphate kinase
MVITRTPLRISLCGGGSDLPAFYEQGIQGHTIGVSINKYMYINVNPHFDSNSWRLGYSLTEEVPSFTHFRHDLARECLKFTSPWEDSLEIHSIADVPGGTGLGSSSAFTVGLLRALWVIQGRKGVPARVVADKACHIEIDRCNHPIGKQDQYLVSLGGLNYLTFDPDGTVTHAPLALTWEAEEEFHSRLLLLWTGVPRDANKILAVHSQSMVTQGSRDIVRTLAHLAEEFRKCLVNSEWLMCGEILHESWRVKRRLSGVTNIDIDNFYNLGLMAGADGGKICGAGGGGFILFMAAPEKHAEIIKMTGLERLPFKFDQDGSKVIYKSESGDGGYG